MVLSHLFPCHNTGASVEEDLYPEYMYYLLKENEICMPMYVLYTLKKQYIYLNICIIQNICIIYCKK